MTPPTPWWYSGDDEANTAEGESPAAGTDWSGLILGAQRMVDWATERVMVPHAEHADPRENPTCVVCRTMVLLGEVPGAAARTGGTDGVTAEGAATIQWIPIRGDVAEP